MESSLEAEPIQCKIPGKINFSLAEMNSIDTEIQKLLDKVAIRLASFYPKYFRSNLFVIPKKNGELRPLINLKPLNDFVKYHHFKMESLPHMVDLLSVGQYMTTIDLKDAYFTIPIHNEHSKYLRFEWNSTINS